MRKCLSHLVWMKSLCRVHLGVITSLGVGVRMTVGQHSKAHPQRSWSETMVGCDGNRLLDLRLLRRWHQRNCRWHRVVNSRVMVQDVSRGKHLVALDAFVTFGGPIVEMDLLFVRHHVPVAAETLRANITVVAFDARVGHHMPGEVTGSDESFVARWTDVVPLVGVDFFVGLEVPEGGKLLAADFALVRLFTGMRPQMYRQIVLLSESSGAIAASKRLLSTMRSK